MTFPPKFLESFFVQGVEMCTHMSFVTPNNIWVSDTRNNIIFTNTNGEKLYHVKCYQRCNGIHTVSSDGELLYMDNNNDIKKLLADLNFTTTFLETNNSNLQPLCVHYCQFTGDILVGTTRKKEIQTIDLEINYIDEYENQGG